jgi:DNA-binding GntR family transcriptional regulator
MAACAFPGELRAYRDLNRRFHSVIFTASGRSYLVRTLAQLWSAFPTMLWSNIPRVAVTSVPERDLPDIEEHAEIVAAFAAHNPDRAERAVRNHIRAAADSLLSAIRGQL